MNEQNGLRITPERIEEYLQARKADGLTRNTLQSYRIKLNHIYNALPVGDKVIYRGTICGIADSYQNQGWSNQAINVLLAAADSFVIWCERPELQANVRLDREPTVQPEMTRAEYLRLLSAARVLDKEREYLMIKLIVLTGVTVTEMRSVTIDDVKRGWLVCGTETHRIPHALQQEMLDYMQRNGLRSGFFFRGLGEESISRSFVTRTISALADPARVDEKKCNPRCLRRLYQDTQAQLQETMQTLVDQAHERMLENEQRLNGWTA